MVNDDTIPTIAELKGNTILELLSNVYTTLKNAIFGKQNKLIAGDNIIIDEATNRISAITGGEPVLEDYYTKEETDVLLGDYYDKSEVDDFLTGIEGDLRDVNTELDDKADADTVYTTSEVDALLEENGYKIVNTITPSVETEYGYKYIKIDNLLNNDIVDISFTVHMRTLSTTDFDARVMHSSFVFKNSIRKTVNDEGGFSSLFNSGGILTGDIVGNNIVVESSLVDTYCKLYITGTRTTLSNGAFVNTSTLCNDITITDCTILRRA